MAFGPDLPLVSNGVGFRTNFGPIVLDPGARVAAYVRSTGAVSDEDPVVANNLVSTIAAGLARCRAGMNDVVFVLPGHVETVSGTTMTSGLKAGTRVIGLGVGTNRPTLTFGTTTAQLVLDDANCSFSNMILNMNGAVVAKGINVTAAGCGIYGCDIDVATVASTNLATVGIEVGTAAHGFELKGNYIHGVADGGSTSVVIVAGVANGVVIEGNVIQAAVATVTIGVINVTAAALNLRIANNICENRLASSSAGISVTGAVACSGVAYGNFCGTNAGAPGTSGLTLNAASLLRCFQNFSTDTGGAATNSGILSPVAVANS